MMKRFRQILAVTAVLAVIPLHSCSGSRSSEATGMADEFVNAYFSAGYEEAARLCSEDFAALVRESAAVIDSLPQAVREEFMELSAGMTAHVVEVHEFGRDSVVVDYDIIYPGEIEPMRSAVVVVRDSDAGTWAVTEVREWQ